MYNIIGRWKLWFAFSGLLLLGSIVFIALGGLKLSIDFTGGSLLEVSFGGTRPSPEEVVNVLASQNLGTVQAQPAGERAMALRFRTATNDEREAVMGKLQEQFKEVSEVSFDAIGPTVGRELRQKALVAIALVLIGIIVYLSWAFRQSSSFVSSWIFGLNAIIALIHDVLITTGAFALLGFLGKVEIDILFVTALLTVIGFSVHDTIVVFDRIREGLRMHGGTLSFTDILNRSVNETLARSINTSVTALIILAALYLFGAFNTKPFVLALLIGITIGTYSSIFIASPLLLFWSKRR